MKNCCCFHWLDLLGRPMVRGSVKMFRGDLLFSRAWSLGNCANAWTPSFIRNISAKKWKAAVLQEGPSHVMAALPFINISLCCSQGAPQIAKGCKRGAASSSSTFVKGLRTGKATSFYGYDTPEGLGFTLSCRSAFPLGKKASVILPSLQDSASINWDIMDIWMWRVIGSGPGRDSVSRRLEHMISICHSNDIQCEVEEGSSLHQKPMNHIWSPWLPRDSKRHERMLPNSLQWNSFF